MASGQAIVFHGEIRRELIRAIALAELWKRANRRPVIDAANARGLSDQFIVIHDAIHVNLIMTLARLFDVKRNVLSFQELFRKLKPTDVDDPTAFARAQSLLQATQASPHQDEIKRLRHAVLAHTELSGKGHEARYGDEMTLLNDAIAIFERFCESIFTPSQLKTAPKVLASKAAGFWSLLERRRS